MDRDADHHFVASRTIAKPDKLLLAGAIALLLGVIGYRTLSGEGEVPAGPADAALTIEQLTELTRENPDDALAWQQLGFARFERGEYAEAATAYRSAVEADPGSAVLWSSLGEARVMASQRDPMPRLALEAFRKAIELDARDERARYFLAVNRDLEGDHAGAIDDWLTLLGDTPAGAPWEADLRRTIEQVGAINSIEVAERIAAALEKRDAMPPPAGMGRTGPTEQDLRAAAGIPPSEQQTMARGMVERLEARLAQQPADIDGWIMLMRSRMVLGQPDLAARALRDAIAANPSRRRQLEDAARVQGVAL